MKRQTDVTSSSLSPFLFVAAAILLLGWPGLVKADEARTIATSSDITGKGGWMTCQPFAEDLYGRLHRAGIEAHLVIYQWTNTRLRSGKHAVVIFRDQAGRYLLMDNHTSQPVWVAGSDAAEWIRSFERGRTSRVLSTQTWRKAGWVLASANGTQRGSQLLQRMP